MLLTRKSSDPTFAQSAHQGRLARSVAGMTGKTIDRRTFLKRSGISLGVGAVAAQLPFNIVEEAQAAQPASGGNTEVKRTI